MLKRSKAKSANINADAQAMFGGGAVNLTPQTFSDGSSGASQPNGWKSKKDRITGKVTHFLKRDGKQKIPKQENQTHTIKAAYLQNGFQNDFNLYANAINSIMKNMDGTDGEYQQIMANIEAIHNTILNGMNLQTFHDLLLSNPSWERFFLTQFFDVKDANGKSIPIGNLKIFNGSSQMPMVNLIRTDGDKQNVFSIGRLEVIPITSTIYMSLSTKGGFFYRDGDILVPFERLTELGFMKMAEYLSSQQFADAAKQVAMAFNSQIKEFDTTGAVPPNPNKVIIGVNPGDTFGVFSQSNGSQKNNDNNSQSGSQVSGAQVGDQQGNRDDKFHAGSFLAAGRYKDKVLNKNKKQDYATLFGRMSLWGYNSNDSADVNSFLNGLDLFALVEGATPDQVLNLVNEPHPNDAEKESIQIVSNFLRDVKERRDLRDKYYTALVRAFAAEYKIPPGVIPTDNAATFYSKVLASNDPNMHIYKDLWEGFVTNDTADFMEKRTERIRAELGGSSQGQRHSSEATQESGYSKGSTFGNARTGASSGDKWTSGSYGGNKQTSSQGQTKWDQAQYRNDPYNYGDSYVNYGAKTIRNEHRSQANKPKDNKEKWVAGEAKSSGSSTNSSTSEEKWKTSNSKSSGNSSTRSSSAGASDSKKTTTVNTAELGSQIRQFANTREIYGSAHEEVRRKMQQRLRKASDADIGGALRRVSEYLDSETGTSVSPSRVSSFVEDFLESGVADPRSYFPEIASSGIDGEEIVDTFNRALGGVDLYVGYGGASGYDRSQYEE